MSSSKRKKQTQIIRIALIFFGLLSVVLGIIGIFLPILPTTPFLLLAAYLFVRSSKSLYRWILTNKITGNYIRNYIHYRAINPWIKVLTLVILWGTISYSIYLTIGSLWTQILLAVIAIGVSIHVINLRNMKKGMLNEKNKNI